jgi:hypothetical protein
MTSATAVTSRTEPLLLDWAAAAARPPTAPRPTPQTTVEAVMYSVRERGTRALLEPANQERLKRCDAAARMQINQRIERMIAAGSGAVEVQSNG